MTCDICKQTKEGVFYTREIGKDVTFVKCDICAKPTGTAGYIEVSTN